MNDSVLPHLNASLNAVSGFFLLAGFYFIRRRRVRPHLACMLTALGFSVAFLVSYVAYHYSYGSVKFTGTGAVRYVYLFILFTHVVLAALIVPLVTFTLRRALRGEFARHRAVARLTYPLWLYVSVTGVVVYLMLYRFYPPR